MPLLNLTHNSHSAKQNTQAIITVDNEVGEVGSDDPGGFEKYVLGKINCKQFGSPLIAKMASNNGYTVEFFTDVYESTLYGEQKFEPACVDLVKEGHYIQLHTHPGFEFDSNRRNLYEYTLAEQRQIISVGAKRIESWTGISPIAHRAGMYGASDQTIEALSANNIPIDSSYFHSHDNCKLHCLPRNQVFTFQGLNVIEIPITTVEIRPTVLGFPLLKPLRYNKLDVNGMNARAISRAITSLIGQVEFIVIFLHSSSFIKRGKNSLTVDKRAISSFQSAMSTLRHHNVNVTSFKQIYDKQLRSN